MRDTAGEVRTKTKVTFLYEILDIDALVLANQQRYVSAECGQWMSPIGSNIVMADRNV